MDTKICRRLYFAFLPNHSYLASLLLAFPLDTSRSPVLLSLFLSRTSWPKVQPLLAKRDRRPAKANGAILLILFIVLRSRFMTL